MGGRNKRGEWNERGQLCDERGESGRSKEEGKITAGYHKYSSGLFWKSRVTRRTISHLDQLETLFPDQGGVSP